MSVVANDQHASLKLAEKNIYQTLWSKRYTEVLNIICYDSF